MQVDIVEAQRQLSQLIQCVQAGKDVVITCQGKPVARLVPVGGTGQQAQGKDDTDIARPTVRPGGLMKWLADNPLPTQLRHGAEEIDAAVGGSRQAWD